ncbi:NAD(P)-dependent oxidoreductase [Alcaligenaceae bacterium]|nr:NAD(P)-dependent oxidoreductase [Alcaligenaceae bacterium]
MSIRWITPLLGTSPASGVTETSSISIVDVRDLVDKAGNRADIVREKIEQGVRSLRRGKKTVVCCDYGISRSNAVAVGILARFESIAFAEAVKRVQNSTGEKEIKLEPLLVVRAALGDAECTANSGSRTVLVTGASGFIGRAVVPILESGFEVILPSREELDLEQGSMQLALVASQAHANCVLHLANPRVYTSNIALGKTLAMLKNVIDVCVARDMTLVYLSGWEVFSGYQGSINATEALPYFPKGPYGEGKYLAELLIEHHQKNNHLQCAVIRSGPVYGSGADKPKFIFNFMDKALKNEPIATHLYNNGYPALDLMHVRDLARAIYAVIAKNSEGVIHVGTGVLTTTQDIAGHIKNLLGSTSSISHVSIDASVASIAMNAEKAKALLDWTAEVSLLDGLKELLLDKDAVNGSK